MATGSPGPQSAAGSSSAGLVCRSRRNGCTPSSLRRPWPGGFWCPPALLTSARLIIADEPTPGMSLEQAEEALAMFRAMADEGKGVVLITHDIDLAFHIADRIAVFYAGTTVETAPAADFRQGPEALRHPYSKALWRALPQHEFRPIPGFQPYAGNLPSGCLFAPRCPCRTAECEKSVPPMQTVRKGEVRCFHADLRQPM